MQLENKVCSLTLYFNGLIGIKKNSLWWRLTRFCCYEPEYAFGNSVEWLRRRVSLETVLISIFIKLFFGAQERPKPLNNTAVKAGRGDIRIKVHFHHQSKSVWPLGPFCSLLFCSPSFHLGWSLLLSPRGSTAALTQHVMNWIRSCSGWKLVKKTQRLYDGSGCSKL